MPFPTSVRKSFKWWRYATAFALWQRWRQDWFRRFGIMALFDVMVPYIVQNVEFELLISRAVGDDGYKLNGDVNVEINSDNTDEGVAGLLLDEDVTFANGTATIELTLEHSGEQTLTLDVTGITGDVDVVVEVNPQFGLWAASAWENIEFELEIFEAYLDNGDLVDGAVNVEVTSDEDGQLYNTDATFEDGAATIDLTAITAAEHTLTVDITGVTADQTIVVEVAEQFGATAPAEPPQNVEFEIDITNALLDTGEMVDGDVNVTVTSDDATEGAAGQVYDNDVTFTVGFGVVPITLTNTGEQTLTIDITGVTADKTVVVDVADQFKLSAPAAHPQNVEFNLVISEAYLDTEELADGEINVEVTSSEEGELYNTDATFVNGEATVPIVAGDVAEHTLTVDITGISVDKTVVIDIEDQFNASAPAEPTQGEAFDISITDAYLDIGDLIEGDVNVEVTSDDATEGTDGVVYDTDATFTEGAATVPITLSNTGEQTLTIDITGVAAVKTVVVTVQSSG